jgi:uncharacterized protein (TIGR03067 family)
MTHLPARPNLEHLRTQAKVLLAKLREGDPAAARTFIQYLPEAAAVSEEQACKRGFRLADAQWVVARKSGFAEWPALARHVGCLRSMEGTWAYRSLEVDGNTMPLSLLSKSSVLIDGDRFRVESPEAIYEGIFTIDVEQAPHRIDIDFVEGPEAGNRCQGLFDLDGDRFTICLGLVGAARPERFATTPGSGHALEELMRVTHARPSGVDGGTPVAPDPTPTTHAEGEFKTVMSPTLQKLHGEWLPLELITSGKPLEPSYLPFGLRIQTGAETKIVFGGQTMVHAKIRCNEAATPIEIDYFNLVGKARGSISFGLFRWDGEEAVFCMGAPGASRPSVFSSDASNGCTLSRWRRKE